MARHGKTHEQDDMLELGHLAEAREALLLLFSRADVINHELLQDLMRILIRR